MSRGFAYVAATVLFVLSLCLIVYGALNVIGSFAPAPDGSASLPLGATFLAIGLLMDAGAVALVIVSIRQQKQAAEQNLTLKIDLPANVDLDQFSCRQCGGALSMDNIKMSAGAPLVECPYCGAVYQLTEEPKW